MRLAWIIIMGILLALLFISGIYFFNQGIFWIFLVVVAVVNNLYNGPNYLNRTYFLVNLIIIAILAVSIFYNYSTLSFPINWIFVLILIILAILMVIEYVNREDDSSMPWKDEW